MAHLRRGVQRGHAVVGAQVRVRAALLHQVLRRLQVALLARQVQGRGTVLGLGIHSPAEDAAPTVGSQCPSPSKAFFTPRPLPGSSGGLRGWVGEKPSGWARLPNSLWTQSCASLPGWGGALWLAPHLPPSSLLSAMHI